MLTITPQCKVCPVICYNYRRPPAPQSHLCGEKKIKKSSCFLAVSIAGCKVAAAIRGARDMGLSQDVAVPGWGWRTDSWVRGAWDQWVHLAGGRDL